MSWSHIGNSQKHQTSWKTHYTHQPQKPNRYLPRTKSVSTTTKVITIALVILIIAAPVVAANQHVHAQIAPYGHQNTCKTNAPRVSLRTVLADSSWPSSFHVPQLFMNILAEIPPSFHVNLGLNDFFENFVQKYNTSKRENYPHLAKSRIGTLNRSLNEKDFAALSKQLFNVYEDVETGPNSHGCLWRSKLQVIGACLSRVGANVYFAVDYIRSSVVDFRMPKVVYEEESGEVIVERSTYEAVQQRAIFSYEGDAVSVEVISHIQDENFDPPLKLLHKEEPEPFCS